MESKLDRVKDIAKQTKMQYKEMEKRFEAYEQDYKREIQKLKKNVSINLHTDRHRPS